MGGHRGRGARSLFQDWPPRVVPGAGGPNRPNPGKDLERFALKVFLLNFADPEQPAVRVPF